MATAQNEVRAGSCDKSFTASGGLSVRVALLRNYLAPYELPWLHSLQQRVSELRIFASQDTNLLPWNVDHGDLEVEVQDRFAIRERQKHPSGFAESVRIHLPLGTIKKLRRLLPDVVISSEFGIRTVQALAYSLLSGTPLIVYAAMSERTEAGRGRFRTILRGALLKRVSAVVTTGESGVRYLTRVGARKERVFVVPRTTNMKPFLSLPLNKCAETARRLLYPGRLIQLKGLIPFLNALSRWASAHTDRTIEFWLLGDGPEKAKLQAQPRPSNLAITFLQGVPYDQLPQYYAQAGIVVFPTLADEWGVVVNEGLASGLPILGSCYGQAVAELVTDSKNGWTFATDNAGEVYQAIDRALTASDERLKEMRIASRASIMPYTPDFAANRFVDVLKYALCAKPMTIKSGARTQTEATDVSIEN
jgi:glycosyltransferase involved in cell wall biosynthesis